MQLDGYYDGLDIYLKYFMTDYFTCPLYTRYL